MSMPKYGDYKDSGVGWLGEVPAHWDTCALNYRYEIALGKMLDAKQISGEHLAPYLRNADVQWGKINTEDLPQMDFSGEDLARFRLEEGDLLACEGGEVGRAAIWRAQLSECYYQKALHRLRPRSGRDTTEFMYFALLGAVGLGIFAGEGGKATIAHLPAEAFRRYRFTFPPLAEQTTIAAFLDRETGMIDALIVEQEKLLTLLAEKRQATISHAVTRGLNPNAPMKDSGVRWLGEVPAHWKVLALRRLIDRFEQGWSPECEATPADPGEWGVLKAGCVNGGEFDAKENKTLPSSLVPREELELKSGDVLMSRASGSPKLIGSVACVMNPPSHLMLSDKIFRIRLSADVDPRFFAVAMGSAPLRQQIEQAIGGAEGLANNLPQASIKDFWMSLPPFKEQLAIVDFLVRELAKLNSLAGASERAVALLKERRSALIAAAVTGKIDIRQSV